MDVGLNNQVTRRGALQLGGGLAAGALAVGTGLGPRVLSALAATGSGDGTPHEPLPYQQMQDILQAQGTVDNYILAVELDRPDIGPVTLRGVPIKPSFEINGNLTFQPIGHGQAIFNGDLPLKDNEVNGFIDAIVANNLTFQAEHQHFYDFNPPVWFIHWRGVGNPLDLARAVHNCVKTTSTPLPQAPPSNPTTPFDPQRLQTILNGYSNSVGSDGVVTVLIARRERIFLQGYQVGANTNIATNVAFQPLNSSGSQAAVAPDFGMLGSEVNNVMRVMRGHGWDVGCLYNQETDESPQLFFSHQFKTGDPYRLAREVRDGLNQTNSY